MVAPGKKMLSAMSPVIAWKGKEAYALGGRGGSRIPTNTIQVVLNLLVDGDPLQAALDRPRLHHQWLPDRLDVEPDSLSPETRGELERRGHTIEITPAAAKVHAVHLLPDGRVEAASDPRGSGVGGVVEPGPAEPRGFPDVDQVLASPGTVFTLEPARELTRTGTVEVVVANSEPRTVLPATREEKPIAQALTDLSATARVERDLREGRAKEAGEPSTERARRQLDKLLAFLASRRPSGPHAVFLVADGPDLTPEQTALLERKDDPAAAPASAFHRASRLLAAYGWVTLPVPLRRDGAGVEIIPQSGLERIRQSAAPADHGVPPILPGRPPGKTTLSWTGVTDLAVEPRTAALRVLSRASGGTVIGFEQQIEPALAALSRRWRLWIAEPDEPVEGRLQTVQVSLPDQMQVVAFFFPIALNLPGGPQKQARPQAWLRSSTPQEIAEIRLEGAPGGP